MVRKARIPEYLKQKYQPEYERLGVEPTPLGVDPRTQMPVSQNAPRRSFHAEPPVPVKAAGRRPPQSTGVPNRTPRYKSEPLPVQVGNHDDQMWADSKTFGDQPWVDNNEFVDVDLLKGDKRFEIAHDIDYGPEPEDQRYAALDEKPQWAQRHEEAERQAESDDDAEADLSELTEGFYMVLYRNQILYNGPDESKACQMAETLLMEFKPNMNEIVLLKRLPLKFGVSVG